jgi:hypothetical protein
MPPEGQETRPTYPNPFGCSDRYWRWLMRQICVTGGMFRIGAAIGCIWQFVDFLTPSPANYPRNPHPFWTVLFWATFYIIGHFASKFARIGTFGSIWHQARHADCSRIALSRVPSQMAILHGWPVAWSLKVMAYRLYRRRSFWLRSKACTPSPLLASQVSQRLP